MPTSISSSEVQQVQQLIPGYVAKIMEVSAALPHAFFLIV